MESLPYLTNWLSFNVLHKFQGNLERLFFCQSFRVTIESIDSKGTL